MLVEWRDGMGWDGMIGLWRRGEGSLIVNEGNYIALMDGDGWGIKLMVWLGLARLEYLSVLGVWRLDRWVW